MTDKVRCIDCSKAIAGYTPRGGDGSVTFAYRHTAWNPNANPPQWQKCKGSNREALAEEEA